MAQYDLGGDWETPFGQGLHTLMDMTSPVHMNKGVPLTRPTPLNAFEHGGETFTKEDWAHMTPEIMEANIARIRAAYRSLTGDDCKCKN